MRRSDPARTRAHARGFTLVEAVLVIVITGVLAGVVAHFIVQPVQAYRATAARSALVDQADHALRLIGRDLRAALPHSVRVSASGLALELIPVTGAARYATAGAGALAFGQVDDAFDVLGPPLALAAGQSLVFYNLGPGVTGSDAYAPNASAAEQAVSNRRTSTTPAGDATTVTMASLAGLPVVAFTPPYRVFAVEPPVTYRCDLAAGQLVRHHDYGFVAAQPDPPTGGRSAVLATGVTGCRFTADGTLVAARSALVGLHLEIASAAEAGAVVLHHAVHVDNLP